MLELIHPQDVDYATSLELDRALKEFGSKSGYSKLESMLVTGDAQLWQVAESDARGLIVTQVAEEDLFIWMILGENIFSHPEYTEVLSSYGKKRGCKRLRALATSYVARWATKFAGFQATAIDIERGID